MHIRLLGVPQILDDDGRPCPVRGLQPWSVLARVLLSDRPGPRRQLAAELFPETVDPLGSLRWCLAALRRALGPEVLTGDPFRANLPNGCRIDAFDVDADGFDALAAGELLQDSAPDACGATFDTWLLVERARLETRIDARLRRDTLDALAKGDPATALRLAGHLASRQPYDEGAQFFSSAPSCSRAIPKRRSATRNGPKPNSCANSASRHPAPCATLQGPNWPTRLWAQSQTPSSAPCCKPVSSH